MTLTQINSSTHEAKFHCPVEYYLKCACKTTSYNSNSSFKIQYSKTSKKIGEDNSSIEIIGFSEAKTRLQNIARDTLHKDICEEAIDKAKYLISNDSILMKKFRYELAHIHKYENVVLPSKINAIHKNKFEDIDFVNPNTIARTSDCVFENQFGRKELNLWKTTDNLKDISELFICSISESDLISTKSVEEIGASFISGKLNIDSISNIYIDTKSYRFNLNDKVLLEYNLRMKTENERMTHHIFRNIKLEK